MNSETRPPQPVLEARGLSKRYRLYRRSWHRLAELLPGSRRRHEEFWALRQVSFQVAAGEVLGILGPNGAGKSTLLRLLAGTTRPTAGQVIVCQRPAALLELGAGFLPELSGRQNLYMTARLMGIEAGEARRRLPEMAAFAEIGRFLDQPVRTYSAGMVVRLGFAVAAGFDPEILILDEALAVGDAYFQRKTLRRIESLRDRGCSIVLVTHDLRLIGRFCRRALWLEKGEVKAEGSAADVLRAYESEVRSTEEERLAARADRKKLAAVASPDVAPLQSELPAAGARWGDGPIRIAHVEMAVPGQEPGWVFRMRDTVELRLHAVFLRRVETPVFSFQIHRLDGLYVSGTSTADNNVDQHPIGPCTGGLTVSFRFSPLHLHAGTYFLSVQAFTAPDEPFWSSPSDYYFQTWEFRILSPHAAHGVVALPGAWSTTEGVPAAALPRTIHPGDEADGQWLGGDWFAAEPGSTALRWTGKQGTLVIGRQPGDDFLLLEVRLPRPSGKAQRVRVWLAGTDCGSHDIPAGADTCLRVPVPLAVPEGPVAVRLQVAETWSPAETGLHDDRRLGVAVVSATWAQAPALAPVRSREST